MAVWVLKEWGAEQYRAELEAALQREKNKKIAEYLEKLLGAEQEIVDLEQLTRNCLKNGGRQKVQWAFQADYGNHGLLCVYECTGHFRRRREACRCA